MRKLPVALVCGFSFAAGLYCWSQGWITAGGWFIFFGVIAGMLT